MAATDADSATTFYGQMFGWTSCEQPANGGSFARLRISDQDVCSIYQLRRVHLDRRCPRIGRPIRGDNVNEPSGARIVLILNSVGAQVGLWEPIRADRGQSAHG